jgi:hypothetical protein
MALSSGELKKNHYRACSVMPPTFAATFPVTEPAGHCYDLEDHLQFFHLPMGSLDLYLIGVLISIFKKLGSHQWS